jgi:hypothetical protein
MSTEVRRPFGVSFLALMLVALGVLEVVAGVITLFQRGDSQLLSAIDLTASQITTYAVFTIMYGAIVVLVGLALRTGQSWSRYVVGGLAAVRLASLIWVVVAYHSIHWYSALWPMVVYALVAGYLFFDDDAKAFLTR